MRRLSFFAWVRRCLPPERLGHRVGEAGSRGFDFDDLVDRLDLILLEPFGGQPALETQGGRRAEEHDVLGVSGPVAEGELHGVARLRTAPPGAAFAHGFLFELGAEPRDVDDRSDDDLASAVESADIGVLVVGESPHDLYVPNRLRH